METLTISKILDCTSPRLEAEILLAHALNLKRIELYTNHERILTQEELSRFKELIQRRSKHEPIAYITGVQPFMSLDFFVDRLVLIPRPETEKLVEITIDEIKRLTVHGTRLTIADIGTGCGCIAISLAKYLTNIKVIGIDSSRDAIKIAQRNAKHHKVEDCCQFIVGNMFKPLSSQKFDLILSNPPYIPTAEIEKLDPEVKDWEPRSALDGGKDGLHYIKQLIENAPHYLKPKGQLLLEIGFDQGAKVTKLAEESKKYSEIKIIKDLNGKDRILKAIKPL